MVLKAEVGIGQSRFRFDEFRYSLNGLVRRSLGTLDGNKSDEAPPTPSLTRTT